MTSVVRHGQSLRTAVRQRRRTRWSGVAITSFGVAIFAANVAREPDPPFVGALTDAWLIAGATTGTIALTLALFARFVLRAGTTGGGGR